MTCREKNAHDTNPLHPSIDNPNNSFKSATTKPLFHSFRFPLRFPFMASILIIDDDLPIRDLLRDTLTRSGYSIRTAANGIEGLQLYRAQSPELVITDMVMPEQDGLSTIMELRRISPGVRIIAMSGGMVQKPELYLQFAEKLGADRVLLKPFLLEELLKLVTEVLALPQGRTGS